MGDESVAAEEKGTEVSDGEMIWIKGVNQLNRMRFFLECVDGNNDYAAHIVQLIG